MDSHTDLTGPSGDTSQNAQSTVTMAPKSLAAGDNAAAPGGYKTRNWSLFFFFRIMRRVEMEATNKRLAAALEQLAESAGTAAAAERAFLTDKTGTPLSKLKLDFAFPGIPNAGLVAEARAAALAEKAESVAAGGADAGAAGDGPAPAFLDWLSLLVYEGPGRPEGLRTGAEALASSLPGTSDAPPTDGGQSEGEPGDSNADRLSRELAGAIRAGDIAALLPMARNLPAILNHLDVHYPQLLAEVRRTLDRPRDGATHGPLAPMIVHELLRQGAKIFFDARLRPVLRGAASEAERLSAPETATYDRTPITMAFSFPGLRALKLDPCTLASFPDAFREGMAARAARLGDTGRNAPEHWEGELGLRTVHGYFTGSSNLERDGPLRERFWKALRREIRLFNDPSTEAGADLRALIGLFFRLIGLEIVHIELGQDPYGVDYKEDPDGAVVRLPERMEHFGFRDGISQPFVDLGLDAPAPGGGTASRRGTWTPVAPGEIFLDRESETGYTHVAPLNPTLRVGSTYLVFRKLEQDVEGFRAFLAQQRPGDQAAQQKLAAQFVGRWPNGTPLVHSPHCERSLAGEEARARLNDFRYADDDPLGRKCPLGAHIRRANPRDIGGRGDVRHHRILRRGIAYGGPLLGPDRPDDGEQRGILFVAANASIDLQFEVVQGDWLSGGEFLGQVGLGRCPISGGNDGDAATRFLEPGATAPVSGLPSFVTMRGGDYFFAPGVGALKAIAEGEKFVVTSENVPFRGHTMNDAATPSLFSEERLKAYAPDMLTRGRIVRVVPRTPPVSAALPPETVAFVGRHDQVTEVLKNDVVPGKDNVYFSVEPYLKVGQRVARADTFLVGTEEAGPTKQARHRLLAILNEAWARLELRWSAANPPITIADAAKAPLDAAIARTAGARRIDLVEDLAAPAAYGVVDTIIGVRGPSWLTEIAVAVPFARQHVGDLPPEWLGAVKGERPADLGLATMRLWSTFIIADLGNVANLLPLQVLARQAGTEMLNHIDQRLFEALAKGLVKEPTTLVEAFIQISQELGLEARKLAEHARTHGSASAPVPSELLNHYIGFGPKLADMYRQDVGILLLELIGATLAAIPITFASVMTTLMDLRIDLSALLPSLSPEGVTRIVYEAERLTPNAAIRGRRCTVAPNAAGLPIGEGDFVAAVIATANKDPSVFPEPERFLLGGGSSAGASPGQKSARDLKDYLLFGVTGSGSNKQCWGRNRVAMPVLKECLYACGRLQGLRKVAGRAGEPQKIGSVTVALPARFRQVGAKVARD